MSCKSPKCKESSKKYLVEWRKTNPDKQKEYIIRRSQAPGYWKNAMLKHKYGITLEEYNAMFQEQGGRCAICGIHQSELKTALAVDHDHETGQVRGLLCNHCNSILGQACDEIETLEGAIAYLKERIIECL